MRVAYGKILYRMESDSHFMRMKLTRCHLRENVYCRKRRNTSTHLIDRQSQWENTTKIEKRVNVKAQPGHAGAIIAVARGSVLSR